MTQFRYRAARPDGTLVEDHIEGENEPAVRAQLEGRGLLLFRVEGGPSGANPLPVRRIGRTLSLREFLVFNQEFLALVKAGLPILKSCDLLAERIGHPGFRAALQSVRQSVRGGGAVSEAMACHPTYFPELYRASLRSGEQTGNMAEVLQRYIAYLKLMIGVREKIIKALAYPAFLIVVGAGVVAFLLAFVMPTFAEIYGRSHAQLPAPTRLLLESVELAERWLPWTLVGLAGLTVAAFRWAQTPEGREALDRVSLRVPMTGEIVRMNLIIRFARTLSTILAGGIPLVPAMQITGEAVTNRVVAGALSRATDRIRQGAGLAASLKQEGWMPQMTLEMIEVGETTGALEAMLREVAEFHEGELDLRLSQLTTWIEPVLLLVMGIIVGGVVAIMYLPVFQIAGAV